MYILAIETTGAAASVALINEKGVVTSEATAEKLNHLQNLMLMTEKLLDNSELSIGDVSCIAVSEGPGSFTGIQYLMREEIRFTVGPMFGISLA